MSANRSPEPSVRRDGSAVPCVVPSSVSIRSLLAPHVDAVVRGLPSSSMFGVAVQVYRSHQRDGAGGCRSCQGRTCRSRAHAATVITAAGVNPADVDAPTRCGSRSPSRQQHGAPAGRRSPARVTPARDVRSRPSPEGRDRTRRCGLSARSRSDQPHGPTGLMAAWRPLVAAAAAAKEPSVHSELVNLARLINPYPLCGRLFCRCGAPFSRWGSPDAKREYMSVCGCRLRPIDADTIEHRVYADAARRDPALTAGPGPEAPAEVLARLYNRIDVGGTVDDVRFVPRA
jgi:hypothetical protein